MSTVRVAKRRRFSVIDNTCFSDESLSYRAIGLLCHLLSKPDDWKTSINSLSREHREGRDAVGAAMDELLEHGYATRERVFGGFDYMIYECPQSAENQWTENQSTGNQSTGNLTTLKTEDNQRLSKEKTEIPRTREVADSPTTFGRDRTDGDLKRVVPLVANGRVATITAVAEREEDTPLPPSRAAQYIPNWLRAWYAVYPSHRRVKITEALTLFRVAEDDPDALLPTTDEQVTILRAYCATESWQKNAGQYVPSMRRYITERMWEHDPDPMSRWKVPGDDTIYPQMNGSKLVWPPGYRPKIEEINSGYFLDADGNLRRRVIH